MHRRLAGVIGCLTLAATLVTACSSDEQPAGERSRSSAPTTTASKERAPVTLPNGNPTFADVIPAVAQAKTDDEQNFLLDETTSVRPAEGSKDAERAAKYLVSALRPATGLELDGDGPAIAIEQSEDVPPQGYRLRVTRDGVTIAAADHAGMLNGAHTLLQLLPPKAGKPLVVQGGEIADSPRFAYRGAMLDVARHFFDADTVKRHIDRIARYKINYLHLHLADDQGWRLEIRSRPKLTSVGGRTEVGGGKGGFYTQEQYRSIVRYAAERGVTVVPEIDMPGHTNAALNAYPELNCDGKAPPPYTDTQVGFSTLCVSKPETYAFVQDVIGEVAELTPGPYLHIGGDEAQSTSAADYRTFLGKVLPMVLDAGKVPVGWHEYAEVPLPRDAVVQYWRIETADEGTASAAAKGNPVIMSPANHTYTDMKYFDSDAQGNDWAGPVSVQKSYDWDPAGFLDGIGEKAVLGVEAPLWTELVQTEDDLERQAFPRIPAIAEVGWTAQSERDWDDFRKRLAAHGERLTALGVAFHRSPEVPW